MQSPRYLTVPTDPLLLLSSPPCSPLPFDWHTWTEGPPTVAQFDLDAAEGVVCLGDGRTIDLAAQEKSEFVVIRKGAVLSKAAAGHKLAKASETIQTMLPPIIVDFYE